MSGSARAQRRDVGKGEMIWYGGPWDDAPVGLGGGDHLTWKGTVAAIRIKVLCPPSPSPPGAPVGGIADAQQEKESELNSASRFDPLSQCSCISLSFFPAASL